MAKSEDLVTYITERIVQYIETPRDVRRSQKKAKEPWLNKWFGMLPLALKMWIKSARRGRKERY